MINTRYIKQYLRPFMLVASVLLLLFVVYRPVISTFHSAGDVDLYQRYARGLLLEPIELPLEYPALSAVIFVIPHLLAPEHYMLGFAVLAALATGLTLVVVDRLCNHGWWLALYITLGAWGIVFFRYDVFVVLITVLAYWAATCRRWTGSQLLLALGVALKLYPLVLMPLVVVWQWHTERRWPWSSLLSGAAALLMVGGAMLLFLPDASSEMLRLLRERPIEFEAPAASMVWLFGPTATELTYGSVNVVSPLAPIVSRVLTPLSIALLVGVYLSYMRQRLGPAVAWALTLGVLMATSKVFSTQYLLWILPFVVLADGSAEGTQTEAADDAWLWALICLLTSLVFPVGDVFLGRTIQFALVTVRNTLWVVALLRLLRWQKPNFLHNIWLNLVRDARFWWRKLGGLSGIVLVLLVVDISVMHANNQRSYTLDVGAWSDEEVLRYRGLYRPEVDSAGTTYRWTSNWNSVRISSAIATARPLLKLYFGGTPVTASLPRLVAFTAENSSAVTLSATELPRQYHLILPATVLDDGKLNLLLQGPTSQAAPDPRELGVRLDGLALSWLDSWSLPTLQILLLQVVTTLTGVAVARRMGLTSYWLAIVAVGLMLAQAFVAGRFVFLVNAWQSRQLVACCICLIMAWGVLPGQQDDLQLA